MSINVSAQGINWSISKLFMYESCPMRFRLKYIDRLPEPPLPPDNPMERGSRIHTDLEHYIDGRKDSLDKCEARQLAPLMDSYNAMRDLYMAGKVTAEQDWWFDADWQPCDRNNVWLWAKLDVSIVDEDAPDTVKIGRELFATNGSVAISGDHKSGKSQYKTVEHVQQTQLYCAISALKYPQVHLHVAELYYVDEGWVRAAAYTREEALKFIGRFEARAQKIYTDRVFRPNPNKVTCRFCPYSPRGTGACPVGV